MNAALQAAAGIKAAWGKSASGARRFPRLALVATAAWLALAAAPGIQSPSITGS